MQSARKNRLPMRFVFRKPIAGFGYPNLPYYAEVGKLSKFEDGRIKVNVLAFWFFIKHSVTKDHSVTKWKNSWQLHNYCIWNYSCIHIFLFKYRLFFPVHRFYPLVDNFIHWDLMRKRQFFYRGQPPEFGSKSEKRNCVFLFFRNFDFTRKKNTL